MGTPSYFVTCYQLTDSECRSGIESGLFQSFALAKPDESVVKYGTINMYPIYQDLADDTEYGQALYPYSVSFILQYKPKKQQKAAQDSAIIAVPTDSWTIMSQQADKSILLDPAGNRHVLLFCQTGRLFLKHRKDPNLVVTMDQGNVPTIVHLDRAKQFAAGFRDKAIHPSMNMFVQHAVAKQMRKAAQQRKIRSRRLTDLLNP